MTGILPPVGGNIGWEYVTTRGTTSLSRAASILNELGIQVHDSDFTCEHFHDKFTGEEFRTIANVTYARATGRFQLWIHTDATMSDTVASMVAAAKIARRCDFTEPHWEAVPEDCAAPGGAYQAGICRRLSDYGDDLAMVARIPDTVTITSDPSLTPGVLA